MKAEEYLSGEIKISKLTPLQRTGILRAMEEYAKQENRELKEIIESLLTDLDNEFGHGEAQYNPRALEIIADAKYKYQKFKDEPQSNS